MNPLPERWSHATPMEVMTEQSRSPRPAATGAMNKLKALVIGHSHVAALQRAAEQSTDGLVTAFGFMPLRQAAFRASAQAGVTEKDAKARASTPEGVDLAAVGAHIAREAPDVGVLCINGNEHGTLGLFVIDSPLAQREHRLERMVTQGLNRWLEVLLPQLPPRLLLVAPPPPVSLDRLEGHFPAERIAAFQGLALEPPSTRLHLWRSQCAILRSVCAQRGLVFVEPPAAALDAEGFLAPAFSGADPMHANPAYGRLVLRDLHDLMQSLPEPAARPQPPESAHPYAALPDSSFWKQSMSQREAGAIDPMLEPPFLVRPGDRVATAGSCFAQHISRHLQARGFNFMIAEPGPADPAEAERRGFRDFSARYANVYTARQLLQLFDRAFGYFRPVERVWPLHDGGFCDPFRPRVEPRGFATAADAEADTKRHLAAVRRMFRQLDVFVFTLGLTECWSSRLDGSVYPVAPGVVGGTFDPARHAFVNLSVQDVVADLDAFIGKLGLVNPGARVVLTVSPVPLVATAAPSHVLTASTYSKAVLRVAADEVCRRHPQRLCYFPSYEIITGPHAGASYFEADRRSVAAQGVAHVMRVFMAHMTRAQADSADRANEVESLMEVACDEEALAR